MFPDLRDLLPQLLQLPKPGPNTYEVNEKHEDRKRNYLGFTQEQDLIFRKQNDEVCKEKIASMNLLIEARMEHKIKMTKINFGSFTPKEISCIFSGNNLGSARVTKGKFFRDGKWEKTNLLKLKFITIFIL